MGGWRIPRRGSMLVHTILAFILVMPFVSTSHIKRSRHHRDSLTSELPETTHITLLETNPCLVQYCMKGRECVLENDMPKCICQKSCPPHRRLVCGSDGHIYPNHCELHRAACLTATAITVQRGVHCVKDGKGWAPSAPMHLMPGYVQLTTTPATTSTSTSTISHVDTETDVGVNAGNPTETAEFELEDNGVETATHVPNYQENEIPVEEDNEKTSELYYEKDECSMQEYEIMKDNLLLYNHARLMSQDNHSKDYLVSIMFSHYDRNNNGNLEATELNEIAVQERLDTLSNGCTLSNMIQYDDTDHDGKLSINEFYVAFSKLYSVSVVSLDKALETNRLTARVGDNVEIKCDVTGSPVPPIVWRRNQIDLSTINEEDVRVFSDGSLYLTRIQLQHAGNYTCHAQRNKDVVQTHILTVHTVPEVHVTPRIQSKRPGEDATMLCHVAGEPFPKVEWLKNDESLRSDNPRKYQIIGNGTALKIRNIAFADTGAYMCQATSIGGLTRDISSLVVQEQPTPSSPNEERRFFAFHDWGVSIYEPTTCRLYHRIQSTDIIPGTQEYVCGDKGVPCSWGRAINVANRYVYASQPNRDRIIIISKVQMVVVDVVSTDKYPVDLHYVPHLDQVWILNWRSPNNTGIKTIQVIRDAGQKRKHHTVHPEPIDGQFDLVKGLFIPSAFQELSHYSFKYAYVTHTNQRGLYKLDLVNLRYTRSVDLTPYNCVPTQVRFSALYGMVIMQCLEPVTNRPTGQLILDYLTDSVIATKPNLPGVPYISPDSRKLVTLDRTANGATIIVQEIAETGLVFSFDVKTSLNISDVTFYPSQTTHSYDIYASAQEKEDILFLNLHTGKVEIITGVGKAIPMQLTKWNNPNRPISGSGLFGQYMVTPASEALFVINGRSRTVNCEIGAVIHPSEIVWTTLKFH
ncbi:follistatin-related protein 5-like [Aethina tumida]|uniref:follistatin-related protein 5-like n=1 Tax=Aethina tumida TaxID=116153 RepID=UPI0021484767|nr:follistatin-related protein 5-like [Aethina tumida]